MYFANVSYCEEQALKEVAEQEDIRFLLLNFRSVNEVDASGYEMLSRLVTNLADAGVSVSIAEAKQPVLEQLNKVGFVDNLGKDCVFITADEAVATLRNR